MTDRTIHQLTQGTPEWHQFRLTHYGASEAAAMLGISSKVSRNDLLHMKSTGTAQEFSDWVQVNILNHGHEVEKAAMPYVENIIGEALYPVTCSLGVMSASCDGLNLDETIAFEHKQWNAELADSVDAGVLPDEYQPQCQQIMMVTGAEMVIFVVSDGTPDMMVSMDVFPDADWQDRIAAGWDQFAIDQSGYEHVEYAVKPVADAILALPALAVQIRGEVMMSNLPAVSASVEKFVASIKTDLLTDEDFANAEKTIKFCDDAEKMLDAALNGAMAQTASIDELKRTVEMLQSQLRDKRLSLTATVKQKKESLKNGILTAVKEKFAEHVTALERVIQPIRLVFQARDFAGVMKNKRTLKTLQDAVDAELAAAKVSVNMLAKTMRARLDWYELHAKDHKFLFSDLQNIIQKPDEDFQMVVNNRIDTHKNQEALKAEQAAAALVEQAPVPVAVQDEPATEQQPHGYVSAPSFNTVLPAVPQVETVVVKKGEYLQLLEDQKWLHCLEQAGVDNWDGIDEARAIFEQDA